MVEDTLRPHLRLPYSIGSSVPRPLPDVDTIRNRLAAAVRAGSGRSHGRSAREQRQYIKDLKARLEDGFPAGEPVTLRPAPGLWQGYDRPLQAEAQDAPGPVFDPEAIVLAIKGRRVLLPATLKVTAALRGALMNKCPPTTAARVVQWTSPGSYTHCRSALGIGSAPLCRLGACRWPHHGSGLGPAGRVGSARCRVLP